jgi:hypothetical protein
MRFDWQRFCTERRIHFVTSGPNTAKGNISIKCPFCGSADDSQHMGLSTNVNRPSWGCWRDQAHRGKRPESLIMKLLGISYKEAAGLVESQMNNPDAFGRVIDALKDGGEEEPTKTAGTKTELQMPPEFRPFDFKDKHYAQGRFVLYLSNAVPYGRGFGMAAFKVIKDYNLHWCVTGDYAYRLIIPVYHEGKLVTWSGRAVTHATIRYRSLEKGQDVRNIKDSLLLPYRRLNVRKRLLIVTEGQFDALKLQTFGAHLGMDAVCVFGLTLSNLQLDWLGKIKHRYSQVAVLLDSGETSGSVRMVDQIHELFGGPVLTAKLPPDVKDPGDLLPAQVETLVKSLLRKK